MNPIQRNLVILARIEAALGAILAVGVFVLMSVSPTAVLSPGIALGAAVLGSVATTYFLTLHPIVADWKPNVSVFILTLITAANLILIIAATGGLDSPYYSLWLLAIVVAGLFGRRYTVGIVLLTLGYFGYSLFPGSFEKRFLTDHVIELLITLVAAGLSEWVHGRQRLATAATASKQLKSVNSRLNQEQMKADVIIDSIAEGVVVVDAERRIQLFNPAAEALTGWQANATLGLDYAAVIKLEYTAGKPAGPSSPLQATWVNLQPAASEDYNLITRSGRKIGVRISASPIIDAAGKISGEVILFRDISVEQALERQKDEFISTASHEMRTPVATIEGYISLALSEKTATIDDRARNYLEGAHRSVAHLGQLFKDLLNVTKAEQNLVQEALLVVNVEKVVSEAVNDMQFTAQAKGLSLGMQTSASGGRAISPVYLVAANPERLREVTLNLIDNAINYTPQGGVRVVLGGDDRQVQVSVIDTGIGIATEDIPHLFQKFYRVDSAMTRGVSGTGLGLYLCRKIIELYDGHIWVESKADQGSRISFALPRLSQNQADQLTRQSAATVTPGKPKPILN